MTASAYEDLKARLVAAIRGGTGSVRADRRGAKVVGGEGELPFVVGGGYELTTVDLKTEDARAATLDYSESPPLIFEGRWVDFDDLQLAAPRTYDGWS